MSRTGFVKIVGPPALQDVVVAFQDTREDLLWVVDDGDRYLGSIDVQDVLDAVASGGTAEGLVQQLPTLVPDQSASDAVEILGDLEADELPVVDSAGRLLGVLRERTLLGAMGPAGWREEQQADDSPALR